MCNFAIFTSTVSAAKLISLSKCRVFPTYALFFNLSSCGRWMNMNVSTSEQFGVQWLETMKKKIAKTHIAITLQLVVDTQRTI